MARRIRQKIESVSPLETYESLLPHIDFCSNQEASVDGCKGVIEYDNTTVRLNCKSIVVKFIGTDLSIKAQSIEQITINGNILSMEFCGS